MIAGISAKQKPIQLKETNFLAPIHQQYVVEDNDDDDDDNNYQRLFLQVFFSKLLLI